MKLKKINYFNAFIYIIYIISIIYFLFNKDYKNAALSTISFIITLILRWIYSKNFILLDNNLYIVGTLFILFCLVFGSSFKLYDKINHYDDFLHFWSGFITVKIGFNIIKFLVRNNFNNKLLVLILLLFFAMGFASICEIIEYFLDTLFKMNTQKGGLKDTIHDMIDALIGSILMIIYYIRKI